MSERRRRWRRRIGGWLFSVTVVAFLIVFLAAVWASNHPDAPVIHRAMEWPGVGPWIARAHRVYRPPAPVGVEVGDALLAEPETVVVLPPHVGTRATLLVAPGTAIRADPESDANVIATLDLYTNLKSIERRGDWHRVWRQLRGRSPVEGWVYQPDPPPGEPPLGREPEKPGPLPARPPDPERLTVARELLDGERVGALGPYTIYTDSENAVLEAQLKRLAPRIEAAYVDRWGVEPVGEPLAAVVLFAAQEAYEQFREHWAALRGTRSAGHAEGGMVALWVGGQDLALVAATFVHEVVHLLNRRALGPSLPPWLGEGLAEALDTARIGLDGELDPKAIGGRVWRVGEMVTWQGGRASLRQLREATVAGSLPTLEALTSFDERAFLRDERRSLYYAQSGFFLRYLLDGEGGRHAPALRNFLAGVAQGEPTTGEALRQALGVPWVALDAGFRAWIVSIEND